MPIVTHRSSRVARHDCNTWQSESPQSKQSFHEYNWKQLLPVPVSRWFNLSLILTRTSCNAIRLSPLPQRLCSRPVCRLQSSATNPRCFPCLDGATGAAGVALSVPSLPRLIPLPVQAARATFAPGICSSATDFKLGIVSTHQGTILPCVPQVCWVHVGTMYYSTHMQPYHPPFMWDCVPVHSTSAWFCTLGFLLRDVTQRRCNTHAPV